MPFARHALVDSATSAAAFAQDVGFPLVVKPPAGAGAKSTFRLDGEPSRCHALRDGGRVPLAAFLAKHDIVVNCVLQDPEAPLMFVASDDLGSFS
ncbi:MAG: hypothetical protein ACLQFR_05165 [Streptosporangiaceae bacterium]